MKNLSKLSPEEQLKILIVLDILVNPHGEQSFNILYYLQKLTDKELNNLIIEYNKDDTQKEMKDLMEGNNVDILTDLPRWWPTSSLQVKEFGFPVKPVSDSTHKYLNNLLSGLSETIRTQAFLKFEFKLYRNLDPDPSGERWNEIGVRVAIENAKKIFEKEGTNSRNRGIGHTPRDREDIANRQEQEREEPDREGNPEYDSDSDSDSENEDSIYNGGKNTKRSKPKRNKTKRSKTKRSKTKRSKTKRSKTKRSKTKRNKTKRNKTKRRK